MTLHDEIPFSGTPRLLAIPALEFGCQGRDIGMPIPGPSSKCSRAQNPKGPKLEKKIGLEIFSLT